MSKIRIQGGASGVGVITIVSPATATNRTLTLPDESGTLLATSVTASQISDVTSTAAELNILDGVTSTAAELNYSDGVTSAIQTQIDAKVDDGQVLTNVPSGALFTDTNTDTKWDGGATGLTASTGRTSLGLGTAATSAATAFETADTDIVKKNVANTFSANQTFAEFTETVYALTGTALDPANGGVQTLALSSGRTLTDSLTTGQSIILMITGAVANVLVFPTITWVTSSGNVAPTLTASSPVVVWKVGSTLYGAVVGSYV